MPGQKLSNVALYHLNIDQVTWDEAKRAVMMSQWEEKEYVKSVYTVTRKLLQLFAV